MIKGDINELSAAYKGVTCKTHNLPLGFTYVEEEKTYALCCPMNHYPDIDDVIFPALEEETKYPNITDILPPEVLRGNLISMEEVIDRAILIKDFESKDSTFKEDASYLSMTIELDGEEFTLNTGAERIVQAFKQVNKGRLPFWVSFEKSQTKAGRRVYRIRTDEARD